MRFCFILAILFALTIWHVIAAENCLSCRSPREPPSPSFQVNLLNKKWSGSDSNIAWVDNLTGGKPGTCASQGKLRIRFDPRCGPKRTARIDLWFARQVTGFSFDIGDSPTVNGFGGDSGTTPNTAEVHGKERHLLIYSNVLTGYQDYTTNGHLTVEEKWKALSDHVTYYISHERVEVTNYRGYQAVYDSRYLFVLDGGPIGKSPFSYSYAKVETDIWLSMNRVISGSYRSGTGLCKVAITWV
ncbi:hypothetical protein ACROYT_G002802 [Oculina patagonica]